MSKKQPAESTKKKNIKPINLNEPWYTKYALPLLALLVLLVYARSLSLSYTYLDDTVFILDKGPENEHFSYIFKAFFEGTFMPKDIYYRPLFRMTFVLERQFLFLFPQENFYTNAMRLAHLVEIILHITSVTLLFKVLQNFSFSKTASFMWAAVYAVHPVLTMAVAWIPGRNDIMLSIFLFSYFLHFLKYLETGNRKNLIWLSLFLLFALLTKETAVFIPIATFLYLIIFKRKDLFRKSLLIV
ncbi:MAG: glycosyltransferase family 39 protein, partial [Bacteroidota bacterium]